MLLWVEKENMYLEVVPADEAEQTDWFFNVFIFFYAEYQNCQWRHEKSHVWDV